jgi:hypothetical protein
MQKYEHFSYYSGHFVYKKHKNFPFIHKNIGYDLNRVFAYEFCKSNNGSFCVVLKIETCQHDGGYNGLAVGFPTKRNEIRGF